MMLVMLPFLLLLILNAIIARKLNEPEGPRLIRGAQSLLGPPPGCESSASQGPLALWQQRFQKKLSAARRREASLIVLVVVSIFLICNLPDVLLTMLEQISQSFLTNYRGFYYFGKDVVNFLAVTNSASNFTAYVVYGKEFRYRLRYLLASWKLLPPRYMTGLQSQGKYYNGDESSHNGGAPRGNDGDGLISPSLSCASANERMLAVTAAINNHLQRDSGSSNSCINPSARNTDSSSRKLLSVPKNSVTVETLSPGHIHRRRDDIQLDLHSGGCCSTLNPNRRRRSENYIKEYYEAAADDDESSGNMPTRSTTITNTHFLDVSPVLSTTQT